MSFLFPLLILIHVVSAGVWTGIALLFGAFVVPSIFEAGPGGGAVMGGLIKRKLALLTPILGALTILSGFCLWMIDFMSKGGLTWLEHPEGIVLSFSALGALHAFVIGFTKQRPLALKLGELGQKIAASGGKADEALLQELKATQEMLGRVARRVGFEMLGIMILMASHGILAQVG